MTSSHSRSVKTFRNANARGVHDKGSTANVGSPCVVASDGYPARRIANVDDDASNADAASNDPSRASSVRRRRKKPTRAKTTTTSAAYGANARFFGDVDARRARRRYGDDDDDASMRDKQCRPGREITPNATRGRATRRLSNVARDVERRIKNHSFRIRKD
jgi:hypothetical protein